MFSSQTRVQCMAKCEQWSCLFQSFNKTMTALWFWTERLYRVPGIVSRWAGLQKGMFCLANSLSCVFKSRSSADAAGSVLFGELFGEDSEMLTSQQKQVWLLQRWCGSQGQSLFYSTSVLVRAELTYFYLLWQIYTNCSPAFTDDFLHKTKDRHLFEYSYTQSKQSRDWLASPDARVQRETILSNWLFYWFIQDNSMTHTTMMVGSNSKCHGSY